MLQKSTEHGGVGQSGYATGRREDPALERIMQVRAEVTAEEPPEGPDDRFYGRGGALVPKESE